MAEFKLKRGQKVYHIREFSSVMELARRKLIAPDDPIFVPSIGRWVYARAIQELRPILPEPDRVADDAMELPLEFVEPLAEDLPTGVTIEMDVESMGVGVSAVGPELEPIPAGRYQERGLWPSHLSRPPAADEWDDERPTEPGIRPVRRSEPVRLEPIRSFDSGQIDPVRALSGGRTTDPGRRGEGSRFVDPTSPYESSRYEAERRLYEARGSSRPLEPARLYDNPRTTGPRGIEPSRGEEFRSADPIFVPEPPRGISPPSDPRGWEAGGRGRVGEEPRGRVEEAGPRNNGAGGASSPEWVNGAGRSRAGAGGDLWDEVPGGNERSSSHRQGNSSLKEGPVSFQHWMEEQARRERTRGRRAGEEGKKRRFSLIRTAVLLGIVSLILGGLFLYVRSTANMSFGPKEPAPVTVAGTAPGPEQPGQTTGVSRPAVDPGEDARLRDMLMPQTNPMRTFDQAQDELFGELVNSRISIADIKLEPVEGDRTKSVRTTTADVRVRIKEGKFTFDQQSALVGLVIGKYIKRGKIVVRDLILEIEQEGGEPLTRKVSGRVAADYFSREQELPQFLLAVQAGTQVP